MSDTTFKVEIKGLAQMEKLFAQAPGLTESVLQQAIMKSADILAAHTVPPTVPWITGNLANTFKRENGKLYARWFPTAIYARRVQFEGKSKGYMERIRSSSTKEVNELMKNAVAAIVARLRGGNPSDTQGGLVNLMDPGTTVPSMGEIKGTTSAFSTALYKIAPKIASKFDQMTYRPFKGAPRGYQIRLAQKFPSIFKRWKLE